MLTAEPRTGGIFLREPMGTLEIRLKKLRIFFQKPISFSKIYFLKNRIFLNAIFSKFTVTLGT